MVPWHMEHCLMVVDMNLYMIGIMNLDLLMDYYCRLNHAS